MKISKIISGILSASLLISTIIPVANADFSDVENSKAIDVVTGIGIMNGDIDGTFSPEANLTRAEFAQIVADIYNYGTEDDAVAQWKQDFFEGVFEAETEFIPPEVMNQTASALYSDVQEGSEFYEAIALVTRVNAMNGIGNGEFSPDGNLTIEQTLKVILTMLGYGFRAENLGGYPHGFTATAEELDILDNVKSGYSAYATKEDVANILYNALEIPLMQYKYTNGTWNYESYEDQTFLSKILNIGYDKGRMTANGFTTLTGVDANDRNFVTINNVKYKIDEGKEYTRDYIGRNVEVYYPLDDGARELVYACLSGKDEVVEFDISDFVSYEKGKITYLQGENGKEKSVSLISAPFMIKNNSAEASFDATIFDCNYGTVRVVTSAKASNADLIILKTYQNFNVDLLDTTNETIYSATSLLGDFIDLGDENKKIVIYDENGKEATINSLVNGTVTSVCYGDKMIEIYISSKTVNKFKVTGLEELDNGEWKIIGEKESYILSKDYIDKNPGSLPRLNSIYNLKLDILGNIVSFKEVSGSSHIAFLNNVRIVEDEKTFEEVIRLKYYDIDQKTLNTTYVADKVKVIHKDGTIKSYSMDKKKDELYNILYDAICENIENVKTVTGSIIRYTLDDEDKVNWIELPGVMENSLDDSARLVEIPRNSSDEGDMYGAAGQFGGSVIIPSSAVVMQCNYKSEQFENINGYSVTNRNVFAEGKHYDLKSYSTVKNSPIAEYIVYNSDPAVAISTKAPQECAIVLDSRVALNEDDEVVTILELNTGEFTVEAGALDEGKVKNTQDESSYKDGSGKTHSFKVEKGDVIRYGLSAEGDINAVILLYDANADYSNGLTIGGKVYDGWSKQGNLAGVIDGFTSEENMYKYTNPFSALNEGAATTTFKKNPYTWTQYDGYMRVMLGSVVRTGSNYVVTTTRNLAENPGVVVSDGDGKYATNIWERSKFTLVTVGKKDVTVQELPNSDLKSYEAVASACDRVIVTSRLGRVYNFIVYRYED